MLQSFLAEIYRQQVEKSAVERDLTTQVCKVAARSDTDLK